MLCALHLLICSSRVETLRINQKIIARKNGMESFILWEVIGYCRNSSLKCLRLIFSKSLSKSFYLHGPQLSHL